MEYNADGDGRVGGDGEVAGGGGGAGLAEFDLDPFTAPGALVSEMLVNGVGWIGVDFAGNRNRVAWFPAKASNIGGAGRSMARNEDLDRVEGLATVVEEVDGNFGDG